ncbi:uncharacterized protein LOC110980990 isoform X2 [Acanthaster planci]|uniref:Uncharacterized protein LOC110980990 isoform X2 n=1 Tax=Acanthaster planci TaxID=133434 RepID=A0A8B7YKK8_ACAPL|nr:uncharacterized protein LOC110980990 isoform X2 [Acanthaster planci]
MSVKIILLAVVVAVAVFVVAGGYMVFFTNLLGWKNKGEMDSMNSTEGALPPDGDPTLTPGDEDEMVDEIFPDFMTNDVKLKLILKALDILKTLEGENPDYVNSLLPSNDEMTDELKIRLILQAITLLEDKPLTSTFAGHVVARLKLTLILKAISILKEVKVVSDDLKFILVRKALHILKVYQGDFEDTVFHTKNRLHLKFKLTLLYLSWHKAGRRHARDVGSVWPIRGEEADHTGSQLKPRVRVRIDNGALIPDVDVSTPSASGGEVDEGIRVKPTLRVRIDNGALIPDVVTTQTTARGRVLPGKKKLLKIFKWLKWLP